MDEKYAGLLAGFSLFQGFTVQGAARILERGEIKRYDFGAMPFREGEAADFVLLVLEGKLEVFVERNANPLLLTEVGPGTVLGELAVLCGIRRTATVRANSAVMALLWSAVVFRNMLLRYPLLSERIFRESLRTVLEKERSLIDSVAHTQKSAPSVK